MHRAKYIIQIRPLPSEAIIPSDVKDGSHSFGPAVFWLSNPNNTLINNVGVAGLGVAFWFQIERTPSGQYIDIPYNPQTAPWGVIDNNVGHSIKEGLSTCPDLGGVDGTTNRADKKLINRLTVYGAGVGMIDMHHFLFYTISPLCSGIWPCGRGPQYYENMIISDTQLGMQVPTIQYFDTVAFVSTSGLYFLPNP